MKRILENGKYVVYLGIVGTFLASIMLFALTTFKLLKETYVALVYTGDLTALAASVISALDSYILAVIVYIFSISLYELFIGNLKVPQWLVVHNLDDLKKKLSSVIALILAVLFLKHVIKWENGLETLYFAISIALMIGVLIAYMIVKENFASKH
ncbi:TPA: YqhA family protein [Candidatus Woesearchaeota archaeon]|nr:YqhA family protein [Candidatus Woesearchaeota archaeon]